ncbi:hypothetical protein POVCU2_0046630 [Plasmodium ovale curtisi]|uniref:Uncharacterized protein n=1 Tax=Plasmodium ovale curtisi TaxID=864141 RepID=A0A1A8W5T9_PLAOA|nr:hypothetical protein POVCU2_0046630 [Plasmodium ovale curtisi]SBT01795.1 hypothetical protein POVCU1_069570 [Plasmodium ovale curtisi]
MCGKNGPLEFCNDVVFLFICLPNTLLQLRGEKNGAIPTEAPTKMAEEFPSALSMHTVEALPLQCSFRPSLRERIITSLLQKLSNEIQLIYNLLSKWENPCVHMCTSVRICQHTYTQDILGAPSRLG